MIFLFLFSSYPDLTMSIALHHPTLPASSRRRGHRQNLHSYTWSFRRALAAGDIPTALYFWHLVRSCDDARAEELLDELHASDPP